MSLFAKDYFEVDDFINPCSDVKKEEFVISEDASQPVTNHTTNVDLNITSPRRRRRRNRYWYNRNRYLFNDPRVLVVPTSTNDDEDEKKSTKIELTDENIKMILGGVIIVLLLFLVMRKK